MKRFQHLVVILSEQVIVMILVSRECLLRLDSETALGSLGIDMLRRNSNTIRSQLWTICIDQCLLLVIRTSSLRWRHEDTGKGGLRHDVHNLSRTHVATL